MYRLLRIGLTFFIAIIATDLKSQNLNIGNDASHIVFNNIHNSDRESITVKDLRGKVIVLEYWAVWCGPCIPALENLGNLKNEFRDDLEIIAISYDSEERLNRFIKNKPLPIRHISDEEKYYSRYFEHYSIPHTVLIDRNGKVAAITRPDELNSKVINDLINGETITVAQKETTRLSGFDYTKDYFPPKKGGKQLFMLQPEIEGALPITRRPSRGEFKGRRITILNQPLLSIYKTAFEVQTNLFTMIDPEIEKELLNKRFCVEVIAETEDELYKQFREGLNQTDDGYVASFEKKDIAVIELQVNDELKLKKASGESGGRVINRLDQYNGNNKTIEDFVQEYLNPFLSESIGKPFVNGTNVEGRYDFSFTFDVEDSKSFKRNLEELGLKMVEKNLPVEVLVIKKDI